MPSSSPVEHLEPLLYPVTMPARSATVHYHDDDDGRMLCRRPCPVCLERESRLEQLARLAGVNPARLRETLRAAVRASATV